MFSLIISVMAVALVVLLAAATMYYGSDTATEGKKQANAAALINQAQQVAGAVDLYIADNPSGSLSNIEDLQPQYISSVPEGWNISSASLPSIPGYVAYPIQGDNVKKLSLCEEVNKKLGITTSIPQCSAIAANFVGCCTTP